MKYVDRKKLDSPKYFRFKRIKECRDALCPEAVICSTDVLTHVAPLHTGDHQAPVIHAVSVPGAREQLPAPAPPPFYVRPLSRNLNKAKEIEVC